MHKFVAWVRRPKALFPFMVFGAITVALLLVTFSMWLYGESGAAQLDLSRPSYESVRSQVRQTESFAEFEPSGGPLNEEDFAQFEELFLDRYEKNEENNMKHHRNAFSPRELSDDTLGISVERE